MADLANIVALNPEQKAKLAALHTLCRQRLAVKLPESLFSPMCAAYEKVQALDTLVAEEALLIELKRRAVATDGSRTEVLISGEEHVRLVWQYYFIENPYRFGGTAHEFIAAAQ